MAVSRKKGSVKSSKKSNVNCSERKVSTISKKKNDGTMLNQMIQDRAYYIWEERGKPLGRDFDIWFQAEKDIFARIKS